jgi:hypothetical protein
MFFSFLSLQHKTLDREKKKEHRRMEQLLNSRVPSQNPRSNIDSKALLDIISGVGMGASLNPDLRSYGNENPRLISRSLEFEYRFNNDYFTRHVGGILFSAKSRHGINQEGEQTFVSLHHFFTEDPSEVFKHIKTNKNELIYKSFFKSLKRCLLDGFLPIGVQSSSPLRSSLKIAVLREAEICNFWGPVYAGDRLYAVFYPYRRKDGDMFGEKQFNVIPLVSRHPPEQALFDFENCPKEFEYPPFQSFPFQKTYQEGYQRRDELKCRIYEIGESLETSFAYQNTMSIPFEERINRIRIYFKGKSIEQADEAMYSLPKLRVLLRNKITDIKQ